MNLSHALAVLGSAVRCLASLAAILARIGIENVNSGFATLIRTIVIAMVAGGAVLLALKI